MRKFLPACVIFFGLTPNLMAADAVDPSGAYVPYDWSGFYFGVNGGYSWANAATSENSITTTGALVGVAPGSFEETTFPGADGSADLDGGFGGVQLGYNVQHGAWVFGAEADYQYASLSQSDTFLGSDAGPIYETSAELRDFGTLRGRIGYAFDTVMIYATGGLAIGRMEGSLDITGGTPEDPADTTFSDSGSETAVGYAIGGGVEAAIGRSNWTVKGEYLYADFGGQDFDFSFAESGGSTATTHSEVDAHLLRVGLNYRF